MHKLMENVMFRYILRRSGLLFSLWLVFGFTAAHAATNAAASVSRTDVFAAISASVNGDTVLIPTGTTTWASAIIVTNAITIAGAGTNATQISGPAFYLKPGVDRLTRVTGIHFYQADWSTGYIITLIGLCKQFRIDHCMFTRGHHGLAWGVAKAGSTGPAYGVVDHNMFHNVNVSCYVSDIEASDTVDGDAAWARGFSGQYAPGTTNTVCIEDNLFYTDNEINSAVNNNNQHLYGWAGARATFRKNYQLAVGASSDMTCIDGHGNYGPGTSERSTMLFEIYSNRFDLVKSYQPFGQRGGVWIMHDNIFTNGLPSYYAELTNEHDHGDETSDIITNSFYWNNTRNGVQFSSIANTLPISSAHPFTGSVNEHYFLRAPTNSSDAWYPYKTLIYPHPLVGTSGGGADPVISVTPSLVNIENVVAPSTNKLFLTVKNVGGGILSGMASGLSNPFGFAESPTYSLASGVSQVITVLFVPRTNGNYRQTVTFSGANGAAVDLNGSALTMMSALTFLATSGAIISPFTINSNDTISQSVQTTDPNLSGQAVYNFTVTNAGNYCVSMDCCAPSDAANSVFINIDSPPTSSAMIWDIPVCPVFAKVYATWRETGGVIRQVWPLNAGVHQLIIRGREAGVLISKLSISTQQSSIPEPPKQLRTVTP